MKRACRLFAALLLAALPLSAQMSPEEVLVRQTYAKLAFAAKVTIVHRIGLRKSTTPEELQRILKEDELRFEFTHFRSGDISELSRVPYSELVTKPHGDQVLSISTNTFNYSEYEVLKASEKSASVYGWTGSQILTENWDMPFAEVAVHIENIATYSRYAAFTVTITYQKTTRDSKVLFLIGKSPDGSPSVLTIDTVTGNSALWAFVSADVYPAVLLHTRVRQYPTVNWWLHSVSMSNTECQPGRREVCCNLKTLVCGVSQGDIESGASSSSIPKLELP